MHVKTGYGNDVRLHRGLTSIILAKISIPSVRTVFINGKIMYGIYHDHTIPIYVYCASYILPFKTIILESTIRYQVVVALPFWHLLTASVALAETPTLQALLMIDDPVDSSWKYSSTEWKYS